MTALAGNVQAFFNLAKIGDIRIHPRSQGVVGVLQVNFYPQSVGMIVQRIGKPRHFAGEFDAGQCLNVNHNFVVLLHQRRVSFGNLDRATHDVGAHHHKQGFGRLARRTGIGRLKKMPRMNVPERDHSVIGRRNLGIGQPIPPLIVRGLGHCNAGGGNVDIRFGLADVGRRLFHHRLGRTPFGLGLVAQRLAGPQLIDDFVGGLLIEDALFHQFVTAHILGLPTFHLSLCTLNARQLGLDIGPGSVPAGFGGMGGFLGLFEIGLRLIDSGSFDAQILNHLGDEQSWPSNSPFLTRSPMSNFGSLAKPAIFV